VIEFEAVKHDEGRFRQVLASQLKAALLRLSPRARWTDRGRHAAAVLSAFAVSVGADGEWSIGWDVPLAEGVADHRDLGLDLTDVLVAVGEAAAEQGEGIVRGRGLRRRRC
jgi:hypothetical protein